MEGSKSGTVTDTMVDRFRRDFSQNPAYKMAMNAVSRGNLNEIALNRDVLNRVDMTFSIDMESGGPITDQARSGTCWLFAGLNWLRVFAKKKLKSKDFTFSENHAVFWDKFEKANLFLENIISLRDRDLDDRLVHHLLENPSSDGGEWNMVVNIIEKYGLVPRSLMPDTFNRINSRYMNFILCSKLREGAMALRELHRKGGGLPSLRKVKAEFLTDVYRILAINLGEPPESFSWSYKGAGKKGKKKGGDGLTRFTNITPKQFYKKACPVNPRDVHVLISSPMKSMPYDKTYTVKFFNNMIGGQDQVSLNMPIDQLKKTAIRILRAGEPCLFGCEVRLDMHSKEGILDTDLFQFDLVFDTDFRMTKAERLDSRQAIMTHAMVFTGVDIVKGKPVKWKVENSWGEQFGKKGFFIMSDEWFDEHVFEVVAHKKYLSPKQVKMFKQKPRVLPPWHPFG
ncbi:MAG: C1 family peptidase [Planctomycetota bacterium]|jgi:bleomycin hydrolase